MFSIILLRLVRLQIQSNVADHSRTSPRKRGLTQTLARNSCGSISYLSRRCRSAARARFSRRLPGSMKSICGIFALPAPSFQISPKTRRSSMRACRTAAGAFGILILPSTPKRSTTLGSGVVDEPERSEGGDLEGRVGVEFNIS